MFDDPAQEINDLTAVIKQDITALNAAISDLQQTATNRNENKESGSHSLTVVDALKGRLVRKHRGGGHLFSAGEQSAPA